MLEYNSFLSKEFRLIYLERFSLKEHQITLQSLLVFDKYGDVCTKFV